MHYGSLDSKTTVYYESPFSSSDITWGVYKLIAELAADMPEVVFRSDDSACYSEATCDLPPMGKWDQLSFSSLPVEFCNHEVMDVDTEDFESVLAFASKWGLPYSPLREVDASIQIDQALQEDMERGIRITNSLRKDCMKVLGHKRIISMLEAASTLRFFQFLMRSIASAVRRANGAGGEAGAPVIGQKDWRNYFLVLSQAGKYRKYPVYLISDEQGTHSVRIETMWTRSLGDCGLLSSAIAIQIIELIEDPALWRECASPDCGRLFKHQHRDIGNGGTSNCDSAYCSKKCSGRARQQKYRSKKRSEQEQLGKR